MSNLDQPRVAGGRPGGGRFAPGARCESGTALTASHGPFDQETTRNEFVTWVSGVVEAESELTEAASDAGGTAGDYLADLITRLERLRDGETDATYPAQDQRTEPEAAVTLPAAVRADLASAVGDFREAADGESSDDEYDAAVGLADAVEALLASPQR